jgi:hypothetical protein
MHGRIKLIVCGLFVALAATMAALSSRTVAAKPAYMDRYNRDPLALAELRGKCTVCHIGRGGGERNDFGEAFEDTGFRITPKLRDKFPERFRHTSDAAPADHDAPAPQASPENP